MLTITRKIEFDAGHRVMNHESKCATLHGHRYVLLVEAQAPELDVIGRVIDFSVLKDKLKTWIDEHWDHNCIVYQEDKKTIGGLLAMPRQKDPFIVPFNPTAENMADYLLNKICPNLFKGTGVEIVSIKLYETPNCWAHVRKNNA